MSMPVALPVQAMGGHLLHSSSLALIGTGIVLGIVLFVVFDWRERRSHAAPAPGSRIQHVARGGAGDATAMRLTARDAQRMPSHLYLYRDRVAPGGSEWAALEADETPGPRNRSS
jgi:hypothetical protein